MDDAILGLTILIGLGFYFLPTIVAEIRRTEHRVGIFSVNCIFGWTVVGWIAAITWALARQPPAEGQPTPSWTAETDIWSFDASKLDDASATEQNDHWVVGIEHFAESPQNR